MQRISIMGSPGSGKSTLARRLGEKTGLPVIHMDTVFWSPGWTEPETKDDFRKRLTEALEAAEALSRRSLGESGWICDGDYSSHSDIRLPRSDTVILLKRSPLSCLWRVIKRWLRYHGRTRPDLPEGCPERIDLNFWKYVWDHPKKRIPQVEARIAEFGAHCEVVVLRSDRETDAFVEGL